MAFAGVWDVWRGRGRPTILTCVIITVAANEVIRPFHDRMPAVVPADRYDSWLSGDTAEKDLLGVLRPFPADLMVAVRVGPAVNKVANDGPACVTPAA